MNDYGTLLRTKQLARDLSEYYTLTYEEPQLPQEPVVDTPEASEEAPEETEGLRGAAFEDHFLYEDFYGEGWAICGVTDLGKDCRELEIPAYHDGQKVLAVLPEAFGECTALETITITRSDDEFLTLYSGAFSGVETLKKG